MVTLATPQRKRSKQAGGVTPLNPEARFNVAAAYGRGESAQKVAKQYGCSRNAVYSAARAYGVPIRRKGGAEGPQTARTRRIVALLQTGTLRQVEIARACGVSKNRVRQIAAKLASQQAGAA